MVVLDDGVKRRWVEFLRDLIQKDPSRVGLVEVVLVQGVVAVAVVGRRRN